MCIGLLSIDSRVPEGVSKGVSMPEHHTRRSMIRCVARVGLGLLKVIREVPVVCDGSCK